MPVGKTKDAGWQIGVSRTFPCTIEHAWSVLTSRDGVRTWLGSDELPPEGDDRVRGYRPLDRIRLRWTLPELGHESTVQCTVSAKVGSPKTIVRFHQELLRDAAEREQMRARWSNVLDELAPMLTSGR